MYSLEQNIVQNIQDQCLSCDCVSVWLCLRQETEKVLLRDVSVSLSAQMQASGKKKKELRYRSVISDIFDGSILSLVQCLTCDRVSVLIAVGKEQSSIDLIDHFFFFFFFDNEAFCFHTVGCSRPAKILAGGRCLRPAMPGNFQPP